MNLTKDKESGFYHVHYKDQTGKPRTVTTKCTSRKEAEEAVKNSGIRELEATARAGRLSQQTIGRILTGRNVKIDSAVEDWRSWLASIGRRDTSIDGSYRTVTTWVKTVGIGNNPPSAITEKHIHVFVNDTKADKSHAYRLLQLGHIRSFLMFCMAKGWTIGDPAKLVRVRTDTLSHEQKEKRKIQTFTDEEVKLLLNKTEPGSFWRAAILIGRYTGLRLRDIACLEWASINDTPGKLVVWTRKTNKRVELEIPKQLQETIKELPKNRGKYVFPEQMALINDVKRRPFLSIYFGRICQRVGLKGKVFHFLRSTYIEDCLKRGIPIRHIAVNVGHSDIATTRGYLPDEED